MCGLLLDALHRGRLADLCVAFVDHENRMNPSGFTRDGSV